MIVPYGVKTLFIIVHWSSGCYYCAHGRQDAVIIIPLMSGRCYCPHGCQDAVKFGMLNTLPPSFPMLVFRYLSFTTMCSISLLFITWVFTSHSPIMLACC